MISTLNLLYLFDFIGVFNLPNPSLIAIKEGLLSMIELRAAHFGEF